MTTAQRSQLRTLEGRRVGVALRNGARWDDCQLVSAGCRNVGHLWLLADGTDAFISIEDVVDVWEESGPSGRSTASARRLRTT